MSTSLEPGVSGAAAVAMPEPLRPAPWRVSSKSRETRDTFTLVLAPHGPGQGIDFAPGQFNMLYAFGTGEVPISVSGPPGNPTRLVHTIRVVGAATRALCEVSRGATIGVRGPYGAPWPMDEAKGKDVVLVAGGIGLAPLRPVLYAILADRSEYDRVSLLYGARTPADLLYAEELSRWRGRFDVEVSVTVDRSGPGWMGQVGVVTTLLRNALGDPDRTVAMVCGPETMMTFASLELVRRGVSRERIWVSLERNMKCGVGLCGHCQLGPAFVCRDGPVFRYDRAALLTAVREL